MEKNSHSSGGGESMGKNTGGGTNSNSTNNRDVYLNHLHKISHKISKPIRRTPSSLINDTQNHSFQTPQPIPPPPVQSGGVQLQAPPQQQPPVYNINKNDFRDVVQRLTGSPAHERFTAPPPPIQQSKQTSSRLQRIRPPPLAQINNRPPGLPQIGGNLSGNVVNSIPAMNSVGNGAGAGVGSSGNGFFGGQRQPLSPLPPFPLVHAAAESPISSYMRFLQNSMSSASAASPRWTSVFPPSQPPAPLQQQNIPPSAQTSMPLPQFPTFPASPLPFGCIPSPRSPYPPLSPSFLLSPNGQLGFPQLPVSPTVPLPSPKWRGM